MSTFKSLSLAAAAAVIAFTAAVPQAQAQVGIDIGVAPECPYGYYDYAPFDCAPYGYYGPDWFLGGLFIGAGPWFHGPAGFRGHVNHRFDPHHGYDGPRPGHGERPHPSNSLDRMDHFSGTEMRDGRGDSFAHGGGMAWRRSQGVATRVAAATVAAVATGTELGRASRFRIPTATGRRRLPGSGSPPASPPPRSSSRVAAPSAALVPGTRGAGR